LLVKGERLQMQGLGEGCQHNAGDRILCRQGPPRPTPAACGSQSCVSFTITTRRVPDLVERVMHDSITSVSESRIFPAENDGNITREVLLCAGDAMNVNDPYLNGDLSWSTLWCSAVQSELAFPSCSPTELRREEIRRSAEVCLGPYSQTLQRCLPLLVRPDLPFAREKLLEARIIPQGVEHRSRAGVKNTFAGIRYRKQFL
jgi:hypothetical protein